MNFNLRFPIVSFLACFASAFNSYQLTRHNFATKSLVLFSSINDVELSANQVYFDIEVADTPIGQLVFDLTLPSPLPLHTENVIKLCRGDLRSIDPLIHYVGCQFDYSADYIETMGRYKWGHVLKGRGRNAVGRAQEIIVDTKSQLASTNSCFGGQYYGDEVDENDYPGVFLTVPILGPGRGTSRISVVRVGESPREWKTRLLINSGVIGRLQPESLEVLHVMARQTAGPPKVVGAGAR